MIPQEMDNLQPLGLAKITVDDLKNQQVIARIEEMADDEQYLNEPMAAREFYEAMEDLLEKYSGQVDGTEVYAKFNKIKIKMLWQALPALEKKIKQQILGENVIYALKNNIDILTNLEAYLFIYEFGVGPDKEERLIFLNALTHNQEVFGTQSIVLKSGDTVTSYVSNWLKDYISYTDPNFSKGEGYELTQYIYSSPNVKKLNPNDRQILSQVISIYNHLRYPKYIPIIEEESVESEKKIVSAPQSVIPKPVIPTPRPPVMPVPHGQDLEVLRKQMEGNKVNFMPAKPVVKPPSPSAFAKASVFIKTSADKSADRPAPSAVKMTPEEIKREISEKELPAHKEEVRPINPSPLPVSKSPLASLNEIKTIDDLRKINLAHLRQGPLQNQISKIKDQIMTLSQANRLLPYYVVKAFEQSPLFQLYLKVGGGTIQDPNADRGVALRDSVAKSGSDLTLQEFGLIADLRKELERL